MIGVHYTFDYCLTKEVFRTYVDKVIDACCTSSDTGKIANILTEEEVDATTAKTEEMITWNYTYQGKKYVFTFLAEAGYGEGIMLSVREI